MFPRKILLEVVCPNFESVVAACKGGADRIELCENLSEGGITPRYELIEQVRKYTSIPIHVMIRPRAGDFLYSDEEYLMMTYEIANCKKIGVEGVVLGLLDLDGFVDTERTKQLVAWAKPLSVTFHRAFDIANDPFDALERIVSAGCHRLLTSGQAVSAMEGIKLIRELIQKAQQRLIVMPGGGINGNNVEELISKSGATEIHASCRKITAQYIPPANVLSSIGNSKLDKSDEEFVDIEIIRKLHSKVESIISKLAE